MERQIWNTVCASFGQIGESALTVLLSGCCSSASDHNFLVTDTHTHTELSSSLGWPTKHWLHCSVYAKQIAVPAPSHSLLPVQLQKERNKTLWGCSAQRVRDTRLFLLKNGELCVNMSDLRIEEFALCVCVCVTTPLQSALPPPTWHSFLFQSPLMWQTV